MYQWTDRVRFSETGEDGRMTPVAIMDVMQDCANFQSDSLGIGTDYLTEKKRAWLLSFWQVFFDRFPSEREEYTAETRPWKFELFFGNRNFALYDEEGKTLARANSVWFMVDSEKMRPVRPSKEETERYGVDERIEMDYAKSRKIHLPAEMTEYPAFPVRRADLDRNHHVNNVQYIRMAMEYMPEDEDIWELRAEYRTAAKLGDVIYPRSACTEDGWTIIALCREDGNAYAIVETRPRDTDRKTRE